MDPEAAENAEERRGLPVGVDRRPGNTGINVREVQATRISQGTWVTLSPWPRTFPALAQAAWY